MIAGIDVGAYKHAIATAEKVKLFDATDIDGIIAFLIENEVKEIILEPTGIYHIPLCRELLGYFQIYMVHSTRFGRFRAGFMKKKGDIEDAKLLREFPKQHTYEITEEWIKAKELGCLILEHTRIKKDITQEINRLRRDLYLENPSLAFMTPASYKVENFKDLPIERTTLMRIKHIEELKDLQKEIAKRIKEEIKEHRDGEILLSIPGISYITAGLLISTYVSIENFKSVKHFKAFMGFGLNSRESGVSIKVERTAKAHIPIRASLFRVVLVNANRDNKIGDYYREYRKRMPFRKAVMRTSAKLTEWIYYMLKHKKPFIS